MLNIILHFKFIYNPKKYNCNNPNNHFIYAFIR
jgi:hypothetical protein